MRKRTWAMWTVLILSSLLLLGCGSKVERNIGKLEGSQEDREQAMMELLLAKQDAIPPLIEALKDRKRPSKVRADVAEILFRMYVRESDRRIVPAVLECLGDEDIQVRERIAITLGDIGDKDAVEPLVQRLKVEEDDNVKFAVLSALETLAGLVLDSWGGGAVNIEMAEEQKADLIELLRGIACTTGKKAGAKAEEILEVMAEEVVQNAEKLVLKGDVGGLKRSC